MRHLKTAKKRNFQVLKKFTFDKMAEGETRNAQRLDMSEAPKKHYFFYFRLPQVLA